MKIQFLKDELHRLKKLDEHHGTIAQVFWRSLTEYRGRHIREIVKAWLTLRIKELEEKAMIKYWIAPIKHLNYKFETSKMLNECYWNMDYFTEHEDIPDEYKKEFKSLKYLKDGKHALPILTAECKRFVDHFGLHDYDIRPRYYVCEADGRFPPHKDMDTLCAVNHILSDKFAPLIIEGDEYLYKTAIIDLQREHYVVNHGYEARVLLKLSFFDLSYEGLIAKLSSSLDPDPFSFAFDPCAIEHL